MVKIFFILVILFPALSFSDAIGRVGNGGNIIVCISATTSAGSCFARPGYARSSFYDTYEADVRYKLTPLSLYKDAVKPISSTAYALDLISALYTFNSDLALQLSMYINRFEAEANYVSGMQLLPIPDTGITFVPHGSELRQLIVQREPISPSDSRYVISKDLWIKLSKADQAHAILHEIFYRHALELNKQTQSSEYIRYFNALIMSGEIKKMTLAEYKKLECSVFGTACAD